MELYIKYIPYGINEWTLKREISEIVHSEDFPNKIQDDTPDLRLLNFQAKLNPSRIGGAYSDGTGVLTLPSPVIGNRFLDWVRERPLRIDNKKIKFGPTRQAPHRGLIETLQKTPYIDPSIEEERAEVLQQLSEMPLRVDQVQFGVFYRPSYPKSPRDPPSTRAFSIEWESKFQQKSHGWMRFEYDHKLIRVDVGDDATEKIGSSIVITFASISKIGVGYDPKPYICFDTSTPPILQEIDFHRPVTGNEDQDSRKFRRRIGSLHPGHARVAPYAHHLRIVPYNDLNADTIGNFMWLCKVSGLPPTITIKASRPDQVIEANRRAFFSDKMLHKMRSWLELLDWPVAFQLESFLHNGLLNTEDLLGSLYSPINELCRTQNRNSRSDILRCFSEALSIRSPRESPLHCFQRILQKNAFSKVQQPSNRFVCFHITFTPTRMVLEGPYATQSNRVIRKYPGYEDNFIRVDFRDEDRLQYRWDKDVDGTSFLYERVGGILKNGFELAGRKFEFLAYSTSALREHAVWFMHCFDHPVIGWVSSQRIRDEIGDFRGTKLLKRPSKYAARLAQAFTATDPSVVIQKSEWREIDDIGPPRWDDVEKPLSPFTDGCGTIAKKLGDKIWAALCVDRRDHGENAVQPSVYQIRFLGYKGVVSVDERLDQNEDGVLMCLRPSMKKFDNEHVSEAEIEIARAFEYPNTSYLNRSLIMVLEDRKVKKEAFLELQMSAVAEARLIHDSVENFRKMLINHGLGNGYRLASLLQKISSLGLDLKDHNRILGIDNSFFSLLRQVAMNHVLRDIKHGARIPIPDSFLLVGIADEGPAYEASGHKDVYTLQPGHIFACIQRPEDPEPMWLEGACLITRSPVVHPGDVQRVHAIGKPPSNSVFRNLKNVVVLPSIGKRALASCLGGGDLDGDLYDVIKCSSLLVADQVNPASYAAGEEKILDRDSNVKDICDFIVEYINSDVLGLLSDRHLVIADQSKMGTKDPRCINLAELCSLAVDYPKKGIPVDIQNLPSTLIRCKPDWHAAEVISPRQTDYYVSGRALGHLYRAITMKDPEYGILVDSEARKHPLTDPISQVLLPYVEREISKDIKSGTNIEEIFQRYSDELRYICATHTLSNTPGVRLLEEEVIMGTILAKCSQRRWRKDRMHRMRLHASALVRDVQRELFEKREDITDGELRCGLSIAWNSWEFSQRISYESNGEVFGAKSFGLISLGIIFDMLELLHAL